MTTIRIPMQGNPLDLNQDGKVTLDELIRSAFWLALWIVIGINSLNLALLASGYVLFGWENWKGAISWSVIVFFGSWGIGMVYSSLLSVNRMRRYERAEAEARVDLEMERERKRFELDQIIGVTRREEETAWTQATQDRYARLFLELSFEKTAQAEKNGEKGGFITRDEWKGRGLPEDAWNRINQLMKKYHIRKGQSSQLQHETLAEAWGAWCEKTMQSRSWVKSGDDLLKN